MIAASIVIRLGIIEALLRFYYQAGEEPGQVVKTAFASLLWTTTIGLALALPPRRASLETLARALGRRSDANRDLRALGLHDVRVSDRALRIDERAKAYFAFTV